MTIRYDEDAKNVLGGELIPCSLDPVTGFFRNGCCETAARRSGLKAEARAYRPHVTLAYLRRPDPAEVTAWLSAHALLKSPPFEVKSFGLYSSLLLSGGSRYQLEQIYRLR